MDTGSIHNARSSLKFEFKTQIHMKFI